MPNAYAHFFGKSVEEAFELFVENALYYQEDVMFMPAVCFRYYVQAYLAYLLSAASAGDADAAYCFFGLVECRRENLRTSDSRLIGQIEDVLHRLRDTQRFYEADEAIYGSFRNRAELLLTGLRV